MPAILTIHDPLRPTARPVGIDLGTTNSLVAWVDHCAPKTIAVEGASALLPSVVHYAADCSIIVGDRAKALAPDHPRDTIVSVKRFMGRGGDDEETRRLGPYDLVPGGSVVRFRVTGREITPVEVSAEILRVLKARAEQTLGTTVTQAVVTVPAYFDDAQRQATKDAGRLAGLEVLRLLNEPTAAALAYGLDRAAPDRRPNGLYAVFDLGGGTFDVTILVLDDGVFQVKSTGGDTALGGDDMDRAIARLLFERIGVDPTGASPSLTRRALDAAREAKHELTEAGSTIVRLEGREIPLERGEVDATVAPIVARTTAPVRRALADAGVGPAELDGVILVGGATRMPIVRRHCEELFGQKPLADIDPDQVVALGAAIQADLLAGEGRPDDVLLLDVNPLSLGIETMGGVVERIIGRNSSIPTAAAQVFTTYAENQTGFKIHVVQGERELVDDCRSLARFELRGIPPMPAGLARLEVELVIDADGLLRVTAKELTTGIEQQVEVKPSYGLTDEEVERMLLESFEHGSADVGERLLREVRVEADRILAAIRLAIGRDADLLDDAGKAAIDAAMEALEAAKTSRDHRAVQELVEALDAASREFAGKIMNRSIARALEGKSVDEVG
ncbi:MAG: Fe-S protein assembly chaperone HscA [Deltaproteobacteria bacterium]|nr:Fe-S protein assembly chaperone HscA [Deltaproteobacteria bacterium]